jgi:Leucine-rich repeat (LRR) protein
MPGLIEPLRTVIIAALLSQDPNRGDAASFDPNVMDMEQLTTLVANQAGIASLKGLEWAANLTTLELADNAIADLSPLAGLTRLVQLNLNKNGLHDVDALGGLRSLTRLQLAENRISSIGKLAPLSQLQRLKMSDNPITDFKAFSPLSNLEYLLLDRTNNQIEDVPDSWLENLKKLRVVDLRGNRGLHQSDTNIRRLQFEICIPNAGTLYVDP